MTIAETLPIPNEFDDDNDYWPHPIYTNYESNRNGIVRHIKYKKPIGQLTNRGYYKITVGDNGKRKSFMSHRFLYECFHGKIVDNRVVDHINNIRIDNRLDNLQLITQSENTKKDHKGGNSLPPIKVKATNIETGESFIYDSLYKAERDLNTDRSNISRIFVTRAP